MLEIRELPSLLEPEASGLCAQFEDMYRHFEKCSHRSYLRPDAFGHWVGQYEKLRGRSRTVCAAYIDGVMTGFAEGILRSAPAYFHPEIIGFVAHIYVNPDWRGKGVSRELLGWLKLWFAERKVTTMEIQVVPGNEDAMRFWASVGFHADNTGMRGKIG